MHSESIENVHRRNTYVQQDFGKKLQFRGDGYPPAMVKSKKEYTQPLVLVAYNNIHKKPLKSKMTKHKTNSLPCGYCVNLSTSEFADNSSNSRQHIKIELFKNQRKFRKSNSNIHS